MVKIEKITPLCIADYEEVLQQHKGLVKRLDIALNGTGAAKQASLVDIVAQVEGDKVSLLKSIMDTLSDSQRMEVIDNFCHFCGSKGIGCYCMRDE
jgi:hypothetical protein